MLYATAMCQSLNSQRVARKPLRKHASSGLSGFAPAALPGRFARPQVCGSTCDL